MIMSVDVVVVVVVVAGVVVVVVVVVAIVVVISVRIACLLCGVARQKPKTKIRIGSVDIRKSRTHLSSETLIITVC